MNQQNKELWTSQKAFHDSTAVATLLYAREDTNSNQKSNVSNKRKITKIKQRKDVKNQKWKWKNGQRNNQMKTNENRTFESTKIWKLGMTVLQKLTVTKLWSY